MNEQLALSCFRCGDKIVRGSELTVANDTFCRTCWENGFVCEYCGRLYANDEKRLYQDRELCAECYTNRLPHCDCCGDSYNPTDDGCWGGMCQSCSDSHFECCSCGEIHHIDDYGENGMCLGCSERASVPIKDYHSGPDCGTFFCPDATESLYFGVELETDCYDNREEAAVALTKLCNCDRLFWLERDCTLDKGIEIISQPCTLAYHRDVFPWGAVAKTVEQFGGRSHDTETCGLHIHFSQTFFNGHPELYQLRLIYLFEKFWDELVVFSRRGTRALWRNANKYDRSLFDCSAKNKIRELRGGDCRYQAVNITNEETIEIRIFRGSLEVKTILASIELVDFLVHVAKKVSTKRLQAMSWTGLTRMLSHKDYHYLPQYLVEKEL